MWTTRGVERTLVALHAFQRGGETRDRVDVQRMPPAAGATGAVQGSGVTIYPVPKPPRKPKRVERKKGQRAKRTGGHLFPKLVSSGRRAWIRKQRCVVTGRKTGEVVVAQPWMPEPMKALCPYVARIEAAHVQSRGSAGVDEANMIPLESQVHTWAGQIGWDAFQRRLKLLMAPQEIAQLVEEQYLARQAKVAENMNKRAVAQADGDGGEA